MPQRGQWKLAGGGRSAATHGEVGWEKMKIGFDRGLIGNEIRDLSIVGGNPLINVLKA
jgi:hypothetical protein